ncbi:MAG: L-threonylcarbamoyladenylate synthase [Pseudomonadota bacterium]
MLNKVTHLLKEDGLDEAIDRLKRGELVALPTETVYGLCARADSPGAVKSIFKAKERPADHPLIVHVGSIERFADWASEISEQVYRLAAAFCPGPLTFILPIKEGIDRTVTGGQDCIGLRIPNHPLTLSILQKSGLGVAGPSANRFGRISPTSAADVWAELNGKIDAIVDGGFCQIGIESTIIKIESDHIILLRPGDISPEKIESIVNMPVLLPAHLDIRVSGNLDSHYAPIKPAYCITQEQAIGMISQKQWGEGDWVLRHTGHHVFDSLPLEKNEVQLKLLPNSATGYAQGLYAALREADTLNSVQRLWVIEPDASLASSAWMAVRDRIARATKPYPL